MNLELIKTLRNATFAGMNDCRAALEASGWDYDQALDWIKVKNLAVADSKSSRPVSEGLVAIKSVDGDMPFCALVECNTATDFSARSPEVQNFVDGVVAKLASCVETGAVFTADMVEDARRDLVGKIKENVVVRRWFFEQAMSRDTRVFSYKHSNAKIGVLLTMRAESQEAAASKAFADLSEEICLQIAGMNPLSISPSGLATDVIERQRAIFEEQVKALGKSEEQSNKIVNGKLQKWFSEVCLELQSSVIHPKKKVKDLLGKSTIVNFVRVVAGEGIEVEAKNLAAEVEELTGIKQTIDQEVTNVSR